MNRSRMTPEQNKKVDDMLAQKVKGSKIIVTGDEARTLNLKATPQTKVDLKTGAGKSLIDVLRNLGGVRGK